MWFWILIALGVLAILALLILAVAIWMHWAFPDKT